MFVVLRAVVLVGATKLTRRFTREPDRIPPLTVGKACGVSILAALIIGLITYLLAPRVAEESLGFKIVLGFIVEAGLLTLVYAAALKISFRNGLLVYGMQVLISLPIAGVCWGIFSAFGPTL